MFASVAPNYLGAIAATKTLKLIDGLVKSSDRPFQIL